MKAESAEFVVKHRNKKISSDDECMEMMDNFSAVTNCRPLSVIFATKNRNFVLYLCERATVICHQGKSEQLKYICLSRFAQTYEILTSFQ
jgi:hypothetical protein